MDWQNFNPRTHVGVRLFMPWKSIDNKLISIHAPMWGATIRAHQRKPILIFQSTHPCGVRPWNKEQIYGGYHFNPRTHVGCDFVLQIYYNMHVDISIHAPMWGATLRYQIEDAILAISIHAPMWGATLIDLIYSHVNRISIHAPMWGATWLTSTLLCYLKISIHAPMWGATFCLIGQD